MAIVNKGFPGTVNATEYAKSWHLGGSDACDGTGWLVSQGTGRQTSTAAGDAFAAGVLSENSAPILTSLSTPTNGQWFLIVRRVDWAGAGTVTVVAVSHDTTTTTIPTVAPTTFPTINDDPGVMYDHKLAWAWVRSTDTTMVLFDLRELPLEPRLQIIETAGAARSTGAVFPAATPAALDAISTAVVGDVAQVTLPGTGVDPILFTAVAGSGASIDWRVQGRIYAATKANLDTATTTLTGISDVILRVGDLAFAADTAITYRWTGSAWATQFEDSGEFIAGAGGGAATYGTGWSGVSNANWSGVSHQKINRQVLINGAATKTTFAALDTILTMPAGQRPTVSKYITATIGSTATYCLLRPTGELQPAVSGTGQITFEGAFFV